MPTLFYERGFRFFFYSNENQEACHVHVKGKDGEAKFWIPSCELEFSYRLGAKDLKDILEVLFSKRKEIEEKWHDHFKSKPATN